MGRGLCREIYCFYGPDKGVLCRSDSGPSSFLDVLLVDTLTDRGKAVVKNILKFTATGLVAGMVMGWLLSLVSGNIFVVFFVATIGLFVGVILGMVHRNDPSELGGSASSFRRSVRPMR
jgi:hypothetical protein